MEISGILHTTAEAHQVSETFVKREFVLQIPDDRYPQYILMQLVQGKTELLDKFNIGDELTVSFNLQGREWQAPDGAIKVFNTLQAWKLSLVKKEEPQHNMTSTSSEQYSEGPPEGEDNIPF